MCFLFFFVLKDNCAKRRVFFAVVESEEHLMGGKGVLVLGHM